jgi:hypothetical protein
MLPLGGRVIQFSRYERNPDDQDFDHPELVKFDHNHLWTRSDEFTVGLFNLISGGSMRQKTAFARVYPDFTDAVFFSTNTVQPESTPSPYRKEKGRDSDGFKKGLVVERWWVEKDPVEGRYLRALPDSGKRRPDYERMTFKVARDKRLIGTELVLQKPAADRDKSTLLHLFRPTMLRLVGRRGDAPQQYVPRLLANADPKIGGKPRIVDYDNNFSIGAGSTARIYAYFEVDDDFEPAFVEYRRHARADMSGKQVESAPELQLALAGEAAEGPGGEASGRRTFGTVLETQSGDNPQLPFAMRRRALRSMSLDGDKLASGRLFGSRASLEHSGDEPKVDEFKVPAGKCLLQVRYKPKQARTIVGDVFNYVAQLNQYYAIASNGDSYPLSGYYAIVKRGGEEYIELFYNGDPDSPEALSYKHMLDFRDLERNEINDQDDAVIGLLFIVPPNTEFKRIENQNKDGGDVRLQSRRSRG